MKDIEIIKKYYGFTTKEAKIYIKSINQNTINLIKQSFNNNAKKCFYND